MSYSYGNWYCKPANEAEAKEIIERAVASGAELHETVGEGVGSTYRWNLCDAWGVYVGRTHTSDPECDGDSFEYATEYTITKLRELFPLPGEQQTEWSGEGLPLIGQRVEISLGDFNSDRRKDGETGRVLSLSVNSIGRIIAMIEIDGTDGGCDAVVVDALRPLRTEREIFVEQVLGLITPGAQTDAELAEAIYGALKSGDLKAPE